MCVSLMTPHKDINFSSPAHSENRLRILGEPLLLCTRVRARALSPENARQPLTEINNNVKTLPYAPAAALRPDRLLARLNCRRRFLIPEVHSATSSSHSREIEDIFTWGKVFLGPALRDFIYLFKDEAIFCMHWTDTESGQHRSPRKGADDGQFREMTENLTLKSPQVDPSKPLPRLDGQVSQPYLPLPLMKPLCFVPVQTVQESPNGG